MAVSTIPNTFSNMFKWKAFPNFTVSVPANGAVNVTANDLGISTPTGYKSLALVGLYCNSNNVVFRSFNAGATGTGSFGVLRNLTASAESVTVNVTIAYCKEELRP